MRAIRGQSKKGIRGISTVEFDEIKTWKLLRQSPFRLLHLALRSTFRLRGCIIPADTRRTAS